MDWLAKPTFGSTIAKHNPAHTPITPHFDLSDLRPHARISHNDSSMGFTIELPNDQFSIEAGSTNPVNIHLSNTGEEDIQLEILIEGIDGEWFAVPVPTVVLSPGANIVEKIFLKPPRQSESLAGNYPFVIRARDLSSGESRSVQAVLTIRPFHYLTMEVSPKRGTYSPSRKDNEFQVSVMNMGNSEHNLQLYGNDPDDSLTYTFSHDQIPVGPGQTKTVDVQVTPVKSRPFSNSRLHGFSLGSRSTQVPGIAASTQAQLEERPLLTPGGIIAFFFVAILAIAWILALPKPPSLDQFRLAPQAAIEGQSVTIRWAASNSDRVMFKLNSQTIFESSDSQGEYSFVPKEGGMIEAIAYRGTKASQGKTQSLTVTPKPIVPDPKVLSFTVQPDPVNKGERIEIRYKVGDSVDRLVLLPQQENLDPKLDSKWIEADVEGAFKLTLKAFNSEGKSVEVSRTVNVVDPTRPKVVKFESSVKEVATAGETVTISWETVNGTTLTLNDSAETIPITESSGSRTFSIAKSTQFTLTVTDSQGRKDVKKITVTLKPPVTPTDPNATEPATTSPGGPN